MKYNYQKSVKKGYLLGKIGLIKDILRAKGPIVSFYTNSKTDCPTHRYLCDRGYPLYDDFVQAMTDLQRSFVKFIQNGDEFEKNYNEMVIKQKEKMEYGN